MQLTLSSILSIFICVVVLTYVNMVENKCGSCTKIVETNIVKIITVLLLLRSVLMIVLPKQTSMFIFRHPVFLFFMVILGLVNIFAIYRFVDKMMSNQCRVCTSDWKRTFLYYYARIAIFLIVLDFIMIIGMTIWLNSLKPSELAKINKQLKAEIRRQNN